jgi:hypothetical protein
MGLANRVVSKGKALQEAQGIAVLLVGYPQGCMNVDLCRSSNFTRSKAGSIP